MAKVRKVNIIKPKSGIKKKIGTAVGIAAAGGLLAWGATSAKTPVRTNIQRSTNQAVIEQSIKTKKLNINAKRNYRNSNKIRETLNSYNRKAKTGQVYFYDGNKINNVYFDQTRLNQIRQIVPEKDRANIDSLIKRKVAKAETTAKRNNSLSKKIIDRVGELDYARYLLTLTPKELSNAFPEAELIVRKALERSNPQVLNEIKLQFSGNKNKFISTAVYHSLILGLLYSAAGKPIVIRRKK
jgi:hypothetical protein